MTTDNVVVASHNCTEGKESECMTLPVTWLFRIASERLDFFPQSFEFFSLSLLLQSEKNKEF